MVVDPAEVIVDTGGVWLLVRVILVAAEQEFASVTVAVYVPEVLTVTLALVEPVLQA
jgi:hypothetical protein